MSGDLISKQALLKEIKEKVIPDKYGTSNAVLDVTGAVLQVIWEQPTAYDVEEVIQQITELQLKVKDKSLEVEDEEYAVMLRGQLRGIADCLEIVKKGGV